MNRNRNKNNKTKVGLKAQLAIAAVTYLLLGRSALCIPQDLLNSTDLQDSPLSLSLTTTAMITVGEQPQQLVISQYGILNTATIKQLANTSNSIIISQDGIGNKTVIEQLGNGNSVNIQQWGNQNLAGVIQEGDANIANIAQAGEQTFIVHQIGNEMVVNITQY
tara:strand:- start:973 stop:1464 length:492 start_codon:yes stop_codon:yes gene_type:complete